MTRKLPRPSKRAGLVLLLLATFFLILRPIARIEPAKMFIVSIFSPLQAQISAAGNKLSNFIADISQKRNLAEENRKLRERISKLESALAMEYDKRISKEEELKSLKVFLSDHEDEKIEGVRAHVIGWDSANWRCSIIVDKGSADGVERNQPVVWHDYVVGIVAEAWGTTSRVRLVTDPQCRIAARSVRSREKCIVEGAADGTCRLKYVFDPADIRKDDIIVTTGEHGIFPRHLLIGTVISSEPSETGLFKDLVVQPRMSPSKLEAVLVIERLSARAQASRRK